MEKTIISDIVMKYFLRGLSETFTTLEKCLGFLRIRSARLVAHKRSYWLRNPNSSSCKITLKADIGIFLIHSSHRLNFNSSSFAFINRAVLFSSVVFSRVYAIYYFYFDHLPLYHTHFYFFPPWFSAAQFVLIYSVFT